MRYVLMIIWLVFSIQLSAQTKIERKDFEKANLNYKGHYITDARLDKFVGQWLWQRNDEFFSLLIEKVENFYMKPDFKIDLTVDMVRGKYFYTNYPLTSDQQWNEFLFIDLGLTMSENKLGFVVRDESDQFLYSGRLIIDEEDPDQASLEFYQQERHNIDYPGKPKPEKKEGVEIPGGVKSLEGKVLKRVTN